MSTAEHTPAPTTFLFAGGGTGGHIYPALAIIECLVPMSAGAASPRLLVSDRAIDRSILIGQSIPFDVLPAKPVGLRPRALWRFLTNWGPSVRLVRGIIRDAQRRGPVVLVSMGGFVAAPAVQAARAQGVPITLVNLDAVPGKANRWMARHAGQSFTTVADPRHPRWTLVPPIVRAAARTTGSPQQCRQELGLEPDARVLMITGGSQGAGTLTALMIELLAQHPRALDGWQVLHQTGEPGRQGIALADVRRAYEHAGVRAIVEPFTDRIGLWWGSADLAISRAGAGAVAEAWCNAVPCVFFPYPYHRDEHQKHNALALVNAGGAVLVKDLIDARANLAACGASLVRLLGDAHARRGMREAIVALGPADGAERVARGLWAARAGG